MNFFRKLGRTVADIGCAAVQKVKVTAAIGKIDATLSEEEKKTDALYLELGKAYFDAHSTDSNCEFADKILAINEAKQKIEDGEKQKRALRRVQRCENCGAEMPDALLFCTACGNKMPVVEEHEVCGHCGGSMPKGMRFCTECGKPLPFVAPVEKVAKKACPACGAKLKKKDSFCTECGAQLQESEETET